jgi:hypothetical protein
MRSVRSAACLFVVGGLLSVGASRALAAEPPEKVFERASAALQTAEAMHGADYGKVIALFESLADRGFVHPDVSFDRGLAYAKRAQTKDEEPGDLGRAAAAFEESRSLRPDDKETEAALDLVRAEVTKRRSRRAKDDIIVRPSLDRLVIGLATERTWSYLAIGASSLLALGLLLRRRATGPIHVAGSVLAPVAVIALLGLLPLSFGARWLREHRRPGVVVASEVTLLDDEGRGINAPSIPEAASVEVGDRRGENVFIRWGNAEGYAPATSVRVLAR